MPMGEYTKDKTRDMARKLGLMVADKPDSQEICFVDDNDYGRFIADRASKEIQRGNFVDTKGNILGRHKGIVNYTIGQRKGLGLALGKPVYVVDIDAVNNVVVIGEEEELFKDRFLVEDVNFISIEELEEPMQVKVKIRYTALPADAEVSPRDDGKVEVRLKSPQRAITPGQSAVFYQRDLVVGGGIIEKLIQ